MKVTMGRAKTNGAHSVLTNRASPLVTISSETAVNEIVYFLITNVEHSVIPSTLTNGEQDLYTGSTVGELGCWVDSSITRMIQTGLEHARVPELGSYLEPGMYSFVILCSAMIILQTFSIVDRHFFPQTTLFLSPPAPEAPFSRLRALISAGFSRRSVNYGLQLTILLKGMRGIGKFLDSLWSGSQHGYAYTRGNDGGVHNCFTFLDLMFRWIVSI